jgi:hypothetical protein
MWPQMAKQEFMSTTPFQSSLENSLRFKNEDKKKIYG